jgi:hypothetical protein
MTANEITKELLTKIPEEFPNHVRIWRANRVKTLATGEGGRQRMLDAGIDGQADISGIIAPHGTRLEIEVKAGRDRLNPDQIAFGAMISVFGGVYIVAHTVENGLAQLRQLVGLRAQPKAMQSAGQVLDAAGGLEGLLAAARQKLREKKPCLTASTR